MVAVASVVRTWAKRKLVPGGEEDVDGRGREAREGQGQDHPVEGLEGRGPVHHGRLLQLLGNGGEEAPEDPDAQGNEEGGVGEDKPPVAAHEAHLEAQSGADPVLHVDVHDVDGDQEEDSGDHLGHEDASPKKLRSGEAEPGEGVPGEGGHGQGEGRGQGADQEGVFQVVKEGQDAPDVQVVAPLGRLGEKTSRGRLQLGHEGGV